MHIAQFYYLLEIEKQGKLSKAAETLFISQSALTTSLKKLEKELGFSIFYRSQKGTVPTPKGVKVLELTHQILSHLDQLQQSAQREWAPQKIKIVVSPAFSATMISFTAYYQNALENPVEIDFIESTPWEILDNIRKRLYTIGLVGILDMHFNFFAEQFAESGLTAVPLFTHPLLLYISPAHHLAEQEVIRLQDLYTEQIYTYSQYHATWWDAFNLSAQMPIKKFADQEIVKRLIAANLGVGLFPELFGRHDMYLENRLIVTKPLQDFPTQSVAYIIYPSNFPLSLAELDIIDRLQLFIAQASPKTHC